MLEQILTGWGDDADDRLPYVLRNPGSGPYPGALGASMQRTPIFAGGGPLRYTSPFNFSREGTLSQILGMAAPSIASYLMSGSGLTPTQMFPEQNLYDQLRARQFYTARQQAMTIASRQDQIQLARLLGGAQQFMTGQPLDTAAIARHHRLAGNVMEWMTMISQVVGPDMIDQLAGRRGSAMILTQNLSEAMRTMVDPISGRLGASGSSTAQVASAIYERLYGSSADLSRMHGLRAGQAGALVQELTARGMMGQDLGSLPLPQRLAAIRGSGQSLISDADINRIAESLPRIVDARREGRAVTDADIQDARASVRLTAARLRDPNQPEPGADDLAVLERMPGFNQLLQTAQGGRMAQRVREMSGVVKAMRDVFGDMGNPNAPMRELLNGLDALTQGGLTHFSPARLESMVRQTHAIAQSTGIGVPGMLGLITQAGGITDRYGLHRAAAISVAQDAALYASAANSVQGNTPAWGRMSNEQLLLQGMNARAASAASPATNQLNAILRLQAMLPAAPAAPGAPPREIDAIVNAIRSGAGHYDFGGRRQQLNMTRSHLMSVLTRDLGVSPVTVEAVLEDTFANQEFGEMHGVGNRSGLQMQRAEIASLIGAASTSHLTAALPEAQLSPALTAANIAGDRIDFLRAVSQAVGEDVMFNTRASEAMNSTQLQGRVAQSIRAQVRRQVAAANPGKTQPEIDAMTNSVVQAMGGDRGIAQHALTVIASGNTSVLQHMPGARTMLGAIQMFDQDTFAAGGQRRWEAETTASLQSALAPLASADFVPRIVDAIAGASPDTRLVDLLNQALGGQDLDELTRNLPMSDPLRAQFEAVKAMQSMPAATPADRQKISEQVAYIRALSTPEAAVAALAEMESRGTVVANAADLSEADRKATLARARRQLSLSGNTAVNAADPAAVMQYALANRLAISSPESERMQALYRVAEGETPGQSLNSLGFSARTGVSPAATSGTLQNINTVLARTDQAAAASEQYQTTDEASAAADSMVADVRDRVTALLGDSESLKQLGAGSVDKLRAARDLTNELTALASQNRTTIGGLLKNNHPAARAKLTQLRNLWKEISDLHATRRLPGEAGDTRERLTDDELRSAQEEHSFLTRFRPQTTPEGNRRTVPNQQAADVAKRIAAIAGISGLTQENAERLIGNTLLEGGQNRAIAADQALRAHDDLVRMAYDSGLIDPNPKTGADRERALAALTPAQRATAIATIQGARAANTLSASDAVRVDQLSTRAGPIIDLGTESLDSTNALQTRLRAITGEALPAGDGGPQASAANIRITGTATLLLDNKIELALQSLETVGQQIRNLVG